MNFQIINFTDIVALRAEVLNRGLDPYIFVNLSDKPVRPYANGLQRMVRVATDCDSSITFAYFRELQQDGTHRDHPLIDYQIGSVRDSFDFGPLVLLNCTEVLMATEDLADRESFDMWDQHPDGGWYRLRLDMARNNSICLVQEFLYETDREDYRASGERQHDYTDLSQAEYQQRMEKTLVNYLRESHLLSSPGKERPNLNEGLFPVVASVVIPVKNRISTIADAVKSALAQEADFAYNVIAVDNCSTDGTSSLLDELAEADPRLKVIHVSPDEGLGIGGCWNRALQSELCGRFAVQLDSDDIYSGPDTLGKIVGKFYSEECAMVIGSYTLTDGNMVPLPGKTVIDHREWTPGHGADNALRVNGFGAPRAFFTPVARKILFPNVSYGEDYAMCLRISTDWRVGRIYESLYNCRRWEGNSDASLSIEKENEHNYYKDFIRTLEILYRRKQNHDRLSFLI